MLARHEHVPPLLSETAADHRRDEFARARQVIRLARRAEARAEAQAEREQGGSKSGSGKRGPNHSWGGCCG